METKQLAKTLAEHIKKDNEVLMYILNILKELEDTQRICNELGDEKGQLRKKLDKTESDLRLGREYFKKLKKENETLEKEVQRLKEELIELFNKS